LKDCPHQQNFLSKKEKSIAFAYTAGLRKEEMKIKYAEEILHQSNIDFVNRSDSSFLIRLKLHLTDKK